MLESALNSGLLFLLLLTGGPLCKTHAAQLPDTSTAAKPAQTQIIMVPLTVEKVDCGEIRFLLPPKREEMRVDGAAILKTLDGRAKPEVIKTLKESVDADGNLRWQRLREIGLEAVFDEQELTAQISVPPHLKLAQDISIYGQRVPADAALAQKPSPVSAYLNLRTGLDYVEQSENGLDEGRRPARLDLEGALKLGPVVLESDGAYHEGAINPVQRGNTRLVYDRPAQRLRFSLGDLAYPVRGQQSFQPLLGLTVARNFSLQPYRVTQPMGQTSFFLQNPSRVEVLANGQTVQTLQLPAGPHNVRDFQFANGANDVTLRITDDVGRMETLALSFFFDSQLLAQGEQEFAYSVGVPSRVEADGLHYDESRPAVSLFHRVGVTDNLTLGLNLQGDARVQMLGAETLWAGPWGTLQPELALSRGDARRVDYTARLQYRYFDASRRNTAGNIWSFAAQTWGESFGTLGSGFSMNRPLLDLSASYSRRLTSTLTAGLGGSYQLSRAGSSDTQGANLFLSKRWGRDLGMQLNLDYRRRERGETEYRAYLSFNWTFGHSRQTIYGSYDSLGQVGRLDWNYNPEHIVGSFSGSAGVQQSEANTALSGSVGYTGYRAETALSHYLTTPTQSGGNLGSRDSFRLGTALVYADGRLALSRPVTDSFVMVVPHPSLKGHPIGLEPIGDQYSARADRLGPGVLPALQSYQVRKLTIDAPDLPPGYELGPDIFTLWPTYKSGTVIRVGTGATVLLRGVLETADGQPVALQAGTVTALNNPQVKPQTLFTNRRGRFVVEGLQPGRYELIMLADPTAKLSFEIPKGQAGLFEIGPLRFAEGVRFE